MSIIKPGVPTWNKKHTSFVLRCSQWAITRGEIDDLTCFCLESHLVVFVCLKSNMQIVTTISSRPGGQEYHIIYLLKILVFVSSSGD